MSVLSEIFRANQFTPEDTLKFEHKLFYEGARRQPYLVRFTVLLILSTIIATYGVINDSAATVIGAMLIAPLMTPIMATAAAMVIGNPARTLHSLLLVAVGILLVVGLSWLLGSFHSLYNIISFTQNSQIVGRISPRLTDLSVALAAGAAGAFAMSREDVADSLPGVAIAISLVPPLCVVGLGLAEGQWTAAWGAMLLFLTNFLSILLAGGGVLAFLGLARARNRTLTSLRHKRAFLAIGFSVLLVSVPLMGTSYEIGRASLLQAQATFVTKEWLADSSLELRSITVEGRDITAIIAGEEQIPPTSELASLLERQFRQGVTMTIQIVPIQEETLTIGPISDP